MVKLDDVLALADVIRDYRALNGFPLMQRDLSPGVVEAYQAVGHRLDVEIPGTLLVDLAHAKELQEHAISPSSAEAMRTVIFDITARIAVFIAGPPEAVQAVLESERRLVAGKAA